MKKNRELRATNSMPVLRAESDDAPPIITGVASVTYDGTPKTEYKLWGNVIERIDPQAFNRPIAERHDVRGLVNHDSNLILGRTAADTLRLWMDARGLNYELTPSDTSIYRDTAISVERGDISGSSFQFVVTDERITEDTERDLIIRTILDVELYDVGPVVFPAYEATSAEVKRSCEAEYQRITAAVAASKARIRDQIASERAKVVAFADLADLA